MRSFNAAPCACRNNKRQLSRRWAEGPQYRPSSPGFPPASAPANPGIRPRPAAAPASAVSAHVRRVRYLRHSPSHMDAVILRSMRMLPKPRFDISIARGLLIAVCCCGCTKGLSSRSPACSDAINRCVEQCGNGSYSQQPRNMSPYGNGVSTTDSCQQSCQGRC